MRQALGTLLSLVFMSFLISTFSGYPSARRLALADSASPRNAIHNDSAAERKCVCSICGQDGDSRVFDKPSAFPVSGIELTEQETNKPKTVVILLFDGVQIIDYSGPWEVFGEAGFKVFTVAEGPTVTTTFGQRVTPNYNLGNSPKADILVIPGGNVSDELLNNPKLIKWIQDNAKDANHVLSVCTGAFLLAKAGLLDGLTATTFHNAIDYLAKVAPKTNVVYDQRFVDNGKIITSAGLSSGVDGALYVVSKVLGKAEAQRTALNMEYRWDPDSKYARAAFADRYLPDFHGFEGKVLSTDGDADHWEIRAIVTEPDSVEGIVAILSKQLVTSTRHTRSGVKLIPQSPNDARSQRSSGSEIKWSFSDENGGDWNGSARVEPAPDQKGKFFVTLKLTRSSRVTVLDEQHMEYSPEANAPTRLRTLREMY